AELAIETPDLFVQDADVLELLGAGGIVGVPTLDAQPEQLEGHHHGVEWRLQVVHEGGVEARQTAHLHGEPELALQSLQRLGALHQDEESLAIPLAELVEP